MPLLIVSADITTMQVDAIVNAANETLLGGGGVDGCIHRAVGPALLAECRTLGGCKTGSAKITKGYNLPASYVIHTVGPIWRGGGRGERDLLVSCYRTSLEIAQAHGCRSVTFPLISAGVYGYPKAQAIHVAVETIGDFLLTHAEIMVYLVIYHRASYEIDRELFAEITAFIDAHYLPSGMPASGGQSMFHPDFSRMLLQKMGERDMTGAQCCKRANVTQARFSRICSDAHEPLTKPTAMAFAIALELPVEEAGQLLAAAGFSFSRTSKFDLIVEFFLSKGNDCIFEINEVLFAFDQCLLGE